MVPAEGAPKPKAGPPPVGAAAVVPAEGTPKVKPGPLPTGAAAVVPVEGLPKLNVGPPPTGAAVVVPAEGLLKLKAGVPEGVLNAPPTVAPAAPVPNTDVIPAKAEGLEVAPSPDDSLFALPTQKQDLRISTVSVTGQ